MEEQRAATPEQPTPHQQAFQEALVALNQDPRVLMAMQEHLIEQVSLLRVQNNELRAQLAAFRGAASSRKAKKGPPREGQEEVSTVLDQRN